MIEQALVVLVLLATVAVGLALLMRIWPVDGEGVDR